MGIFNRLFAVLLSPGPGRRYIGHEGRCEWELFRRTISHQTADLTDAYHLTQYSSDPTPVAWAVTAAEAPKGEIARAWAVREVWRHESCYEAPATRREIELAKAPQARDVPGESMAARWKREGMG